MYSSCAIMYLFNFKSQLDTRPHIGLFSLGMRWVFASLALFAPKNLHWPPRIYRSCNVLRHVHKGSSIFFYSSARNYHWTCVPSGLKWNSFEKPLDFWENTVVGYRKKGRWMWEHNETNNWYNFWWYNRGKKSIPSSFQTERKKSGNNILNLRNILLTPATNIQYPLYSITCSYQLFTVIHATIPLPLLLTGPFDESELILPSISHFSEFPSRCYRTTAFYRASSIMAQPLPILPHPSLIPASVPPGHKQIDFHPLHIHKELNEVTVEWLGKYSLKLSIFCKNNFN